MVYFNTQWQRAGLIPKMLNKKTESHWSSQYSDPAAARPARVCYGSVQTPAALVLESPVDTKQLSYYIC